MVIVLPLMVYVPLSFVNSRSVKKENVLTKCLYVPLLLKTYCRRIYPATPFFTKEGSWSQLSVVQVLMIGLPFVLPCCVGAFSGAAIFCKLTDFKKEFISFS